MDRRKFLYSLTSIAATAVIDPERLLWRPGQKLISIPSERHWSDTIVDSQTGLSFRFVRYFDQDELRWISRMDALAGFSLPDAQTHYDEAVGAILPVVVMSKDEYKKLYPSK